VLEQLRSARDIRAQQRAENNQDSIKRASWTMVAVTIVLAVEALIQIVAR
jgi:CHASE3 domain sensor protein